MVLELIIQSYKEKRAQARMEKLSQPQPNQHQPACDLSCRGDADEQDVKNFKELRLPDAQPLE